MAEGWRKLGKLAFTDTGPVPGCSEYTTVVIIHGYAWHGGGFQRLNPFVAQHNVRLVALNRRDYHGAEPYTDEERARLKLAAESPDARAILEDFMHDRAKELQQFLAKYVASEDIPPADGNKGGIVLAAWSFGGTWLTAWLADIIKLPTNEVELDKYIRRVIFYEPPYHALGLPHPPERYHPLEDDTVPPAERIMRFAGWVSGYYDHGDSADALERRTPVAEPQPTILRMQPDEVQTSLFEGPGNPGGSDFALLELGIASGLWTTLKDKAFYLLEPALKDSEEKQGEDLAVVEVRYLWCDRSVYEMPWGTWQLRSELEEAKAKGVRTRNVTVVRLRGANHFAHWDFPERLLEAFLVEESDAVKL